MSNKPYKGFEPNWLLTPAPENSYRSIFRWGDPNFFKYPKESLYTLMKEKFQMTDDDFKAYSDDTGFDPVELPDHPVQLAPEHIDALKAIVGEQNLSTTDYDRLSVAYGATAYDLLRLRHKRIDSVPDVVLYPETSEQVEQIVAYSTEHHIPLYVYGGGWNRQDTGSGNTAMHIDLPQSWIDFFDRQNACYTYRNDSNPAHSYYPTGGWNQYGYAGLDCSGYLGWTLYNTLHTESASVSDCDGYVAPAAEFAHTLAQRAWGTLSRQDCGNGLQEPSSFRPGDIFSMDGHVWLCIGPCRDGSIVIAHSTPSPSKTDCKGGGVQLSALNPASDADKDCQAYRLAERFMQRYSRWSARYQAQLLPYSVYGKLSDNPHAGLFQWNDFLSDKEGVRGQFAEEILQIEN